MKEFFKNPIVITLLILIAVLFLLFTVRYFMCKRTNMGCKFFDFMGLKDFIVTQAKTFVRPCGNQFFVKVMDLNDTDVRVFNVWNDEGKWYTIESTITPDGTKDTQDVTLRKEITEGEKDALCSQIYHPPYPWYTEPPKGEISTSGN